MRDLIRWGILLGLLMLWIAVPVSNAAADCGRTSPPPLSVRLQIRPVSYDFTRGILSLSSDRALAVPHGLDEFKYAVGATEVETERAASWEIRGERQGDGSICWSVDNVEIVVTTYTKVYIAKEVVRDSCLWQEVHTHEAKHVKMDRKIYPQLPAIVRPSVTQQISRSIPARNATEAKAAWRQILGRTLAEAAQTFSAKRNTAQLTIDTRAEYSRASRICGSAEVAAMFSRAGIR